MSIWEYNDKLPAPYVTREVIHSPICIFCKEPLISLESKSDYRMAPDYSVYQSCERFVRICGTCGWWIVEEISSGCEFTFMAGYMKTSGAAAELRKLSVPDISAPLETVRSYLTAKYDSRHQIHPRIFEEVVGSVFRDLGYQSRVTNYSGDDGIDVILDGPSDQLVGIQVKRYKNSIGVEQIRSLAGAMVLGGMTKGIFVTTSSFQSGVSDTADRLRVRGLAVELMDATRFYDALKLAQRTRYRFKDESATPFENVTLMPL